MLALIIMVGLGLLFGLILVIADKTFKVEEDPRLEKVVKILPGINCGACGFPSCRAAAESIFSGQSPPSACIVGGKRVNQEICGILGVESEEIKSQRAVLGCGADRERRKYASSYRGLSTCRGANMLMGGGMACPYGCLGYGDCQKVCPVGAIVLINGLPRIDPRKCTGCGKCVKTCPRKIISFIPGGKNIVISCSSLDRGKEVKSICEVGCIGCGLCAKICPRKAIQMKDNLPHIDYSLCEECGICVGKCPTGSIVDLLHRYKKKERAKAGKG